MGLKEEIEREEEELRKLEEAGDAEDKAENDDDNSEDDTDDTDSQDDADEDENDGDKGSDDDSDDDSDEDGDDGKVDANGKRDGVDDKKTDNDAAAKARIERKKRLKLEAELAELRERVAQGREAGDAQRPASDDKTPTRKETAEERLDRIEAERETTQLRQQAADELSVIENEFMAETPDYKEASTHMIKSMFASVRQVYPHLTEKQAVGFIQDRILQIASTAVKRGQNPAEVLYQMAFDNYGFDPLAQKTERKKTGAAENLKKKAKNKQRSASGLTGGGQTAGARATIEEADNMSLADFGNLSEAEIDELISQAGS